jgi:hypothetical protein
VKIRYYRIRNGRGFWEPGAWARQFDLPGSVSCGPHGPAAWRVAEEWNQRLDDARLGRAVAPPPKYPKGTLGDFWDLFRTTDAWQLAKPRTREDYARAWPNIEAWRPSERAERLGWTLASEITPTLSERLHADLHPVHNEASDLSWSEAFRTLKCWRALLNALVAYRIHVPPASIGRVTNPAPKGRESVWLHSEILHLAETAAASGFLGMAIAIRLAWDAMLAPVDARTLDLEGFAWGPSGGEIATRREKTAKRVRQVLERDTAERVQAYIAHLAASGVELFPSAPNVRRRDGAAYAGKDAFAEDFRYVRAAAFPGDTRQFLDIRRSAATEARMGGADRDDLGKAMANRIDDSDALFDTYVKAASQRVAEARQRGRDAMAAKFGRKSA